MIKFDGRVVFLAAVLALTWGCKPSAPGSTGTGTESQATGAGAESGAPLKAVADSLKHQGYDYYGLSAAGEQKFLMTAVKGETPQEGSQHAIVSETGSDKAKISVERTGALASLGDEQLEVDAQGVYLVGSSLGTLGDRILLMPAKVEIGTSWPVKYELTLPAGTKITFDGSSKAEKRETITTPGGTFDAILITNKAKMRQGEEVIDVTTQSWHASGIGAVRLMMSGKSKERNIEMKIEYAGPAKKPNGA